MDTFKVIYRNENKYFKQDDIVNVNLKEIEFNIKNLDYFLDIGIRNFKCDIFAPLEKLFKLAKVIKKKIVIQFLDYCCYINNNIFKLSDEKFYGKTINFEDSLEILNKEIINLQNNYLFNLIDIKNSNLEIIPISDEEIVSLYINKINNFELENRILEEISDLFFILNRIKYENIQKARNIKFLKNLVSNKIYEIYKNFNFDYIKNRENISLINEILEISKLFHRYDKNSTELYYNGKENLLLEKILDIINIDIKIKKIDINIDKYKDPKYEQSKNLYYSSITRTNWIDEIEYNNITGILVKIDPKEINKNAYNLDYVPIMDITHTIISLEQILEAYKIYYQTNKTLFDEYSNNKIISGFGIGNGNCMIPLYLNKDHWNLVEHYMDLNNGIIFNRNPLISKKKHNDIYYNIMTNMINLTFSDKNYLSDKWIQLLFSMLRTVYEISKNDIHLVNKFKNNRHYRVDCNINKILVLSLFDNDDNNVRYIIEEQIRRKMKSFYKDINILDDIYNFTEIEECLSYEYNYFKGNFNFNISESNFKKYIQELEENSIFSSLITMIHGIISMRTIIKNIYNNIFNILDEFGGIITEDLLNLLKRKITEKLIKPTNYLLKKSVNPIFSSHINFTKLKKFKISTLNDNNILQNDCQLKSIIIQSIIQRVNKCRKRAIDNNKYKDPFLKENDIINNTGILISSRYIRKYFNLTNNFKSYIDCFNKINNLKFIILLALHIRKTISLKINIIKNMHLITNPEYRDIIKNIFINKKLPEDYIKYKLLL